jgi:hypothetical protein
MFTVLRDNYFMGSSDSAIVHQDIELSAHPVHFLYGAYRATTTVNSQYFSLNVVKFAPLMSGTIAPKETRTRGGVTTLHFYLRLHRAHTYTPRVKHIEVTGQLLHCQGQDLEKCNRLNKQLPFICKELER